MTTKMKGLLKGLRYISQIFESEEDEPEMMIGHPTDVKHVAHIGWDGPTVNPPSWMTEFKADPSSAPSEGQADTKDEERQDSGRRSERRSEKTLSQNPKEIPKSSRRHASTGGDVDPESSHKPKPRSSRKATKGASSGSGPLNSHSEPSSPTSSFGGDESSPKKNNIQGPDMPKKTRRKKSKDSSLVKSNKSKSSQHGSGSLESGSVPSLKDNDASPPHKPT